MNPLVFFRSKEVQAAIRRASLIAGCPVSLHSVRNGEESPRVWSMGGCTVCAMVNETPAGRQACASSRVPSSTRALRRGRPVPFVCHLGFGCMSVAPLAESGETFVLTLGPYCAAPDRSPAAAQQALTATKLSVREGLAALTLEAEDIDGLVAEVATAAPDVVPEVAAWLAGELRRLWTERVREREEEPAPSEASLAMPQRPGQTARPEQDPYGAAAIAAAVLSGDRAGARKLIAVALGESRGTARVHYQARLAAVGTASAEAIVRARPDLEVAWDAFFRGLSELSARDEKEWPAALARLLSTVTPARSAEPTDLISRLDALIEGHVADALSLTDLAAKLNCTPSAVTHALQRKFGMSFTQYVGRLRVAAAKDLLRRTKLSPAEIGRRVGINDASNFARLFKKFEAMTPVEYRARFGAKR